MVTGIIALFRSICYPELMNSFEELGVESELCAALAVRAITRPSAVQAMVLPALYNAENIIFRSETGTGKTLCYLLPAFRRVLAEAEGASRILIIAPTHELASQIKGEALTLAKDSGLPVTATLCIGGAPISRQTEALKKKPSIIVGGPARILELIRIKKLKTAGIRMVILDETDRMLSPEMRDILKELLGILPRDAQYTACSATVGRYHATLLEQFIPLPPLEGAGYRLKLINLPPEDILTKNIAHWAFFSEGRDKIDTLRSLLAAVKPERALVFTAIVGQVEHIVSKLQFKKVACAGLHAKLDKTERKKAMDDFRGGRCPVLVTSDLAARGLDIPGITHVIQLDVPGDEDFFVHRAGRTGRAGKLGINAIIGDEREMHQLSRLEKKLGIAVYPKVLYGGAVHAPEQDDEGAEPHQ